MKDGLSHNTNLDKSNILNQHYSVFNKESSLALSDKGLSPHPEMALFDISISGVVKLLQERLGGLMEFQSDSLRNCLTNLHQA